MPKQVTWKSAGSDDKGAALVEMAVVVPFITVLGLGILEFANYFYNYQLVQTGIRDAARFAASMPYNSSTPTQNDAAIKNIAVTGIAASGGTKRVSWWSTTNVTVTWSTVPNAAVSGVRPYRYSGDVPIVTVSTSVPYQSLGFLGFIGLGSMTVKASHKERVFGVR